jgi:hypothetical protein
VHGSGGKLFLQKPFKHDKLPKWCLITWYSLFDQINILKIFGRRIKGAHPRGNLRNLIRKLVHTL